MLRLAEYFVVVGYDFEKSKHDESKGKIIQRFPKKDWSDYKYEMQVEMFCQPCGWELSDVKPPPTFFVAYLTDMGGDIYYLACLSFHEAISSVVIDQNNTGSSMSRKITKHSRNLSNTSMTLNGDFNPDSDHENVLEDPNLIKPAEKYAPKSLILLARHGCLDVLKNCLSIIYSIYMDPHREISLEYVLGNILSAVDVPPIGGSRISFSIGAGDRQIIQPPVCYTVPVTRTCVSMLFKHLGMQNVLVIFSSLINDQKILLYSRSFNRLTDACHSLRSLLYPLKYVNVSIPILPKELIEVLSTPTPFLAGVHSTYRPIYDLTDVIMVDLDGGSVTYPDNIPNVPLSEPYNSITIDSLTKILNPDLLTADEVYPPSPSPPPDPAWQDKQLRAVFIRLFCRLFAGYRSCLTLTRIRPKPVIHFNQSLFLLLRGLRDEPDEFVSRLLSCMSFGQLIQDRGIPYRVCDVFDEEYESMTDFLRTKYDSYDDLHVIDKLAKKLYDNESRGTPFVHAMPQEAKLAHTRLHTQPFQMLDETLVADHINTNLRNKASVSKLEVAEPRFVPHGLELDKQIFKTEALSDKNKVIREFVANIFNNHITEALKRRNTIRQDLKNRLIRRIFIDELYRQLYPDQIDTFDMAPYTVDLSYERKALLGYQQFDLVNDLMGEALRQEGQNEESGVVPIIMELSTKFCTQLNNVRYYTNMTYQIQDHTVWESQKFWLTAFCDQVNNEIRQLYLHHAESQYRQRNERADQAEKHSDNLLTSVPPKKPPKPIIDRSWTHKAGVSSQPSLPTLRTKLSIGSADEKAPVKGYRRILYTNQMSALDMAAEEMKIIDMVDLEVQNQEEATVYAQIVHFINLIVNFRIPLNVSEKNEQRSHNNHAQHPQSHMYPNDYNDGTSMATSASGGCNDSESGYEDGGYFNVRISNLEIWLKKFVDKTASDNNLSQAYIENIKGKIEGIIEGHISNLEVIYPEVKNIPKVKKVEVTSPVLFPNERVILINNKESIRCYLLLDGRHEKLDMQRQREQDFEGLGSNQAGTNAHSRIADDEDDFDALRPLLPAQGALFVTNYRVVFHGAPKDPFQSIKLVCRSFPIAALKSIKKLGVKTFVMSAASMSHESNFSFINGKSSKSRGSDGSLDVIRICSNTFQMLKIGLELEDSSLEIKEELSVKLMSLRYPPVLNLSFNVSNKIDRSHQKFNYCTGLPDESTLDSNARDKPESISSFYSSMQNSSSSAIASSIPSNVEQKNNFGRNTLRLAKSIAINKMTKIKDRTSPSSMSKSRYISESESERGSVIYEDENKDYNSNITDAKLLDKLLATPGYKEYARLKIDSFSTINDRPNNQNANVRLITNFNDRYQNVKSYQSMIIVPQVFNEGSLKKVAKTHRKNRFPIITWRSKRTNGYLLRGAGFQAQGIMGKLLKQTGGGQGLPGTNMTSGSQFLRNATATLQRHDQEITAAKEQIRYYQSLVDISPSYDDIQHHLSNIDPMVQWSEVASHKFVTQKKLPWEKAYQNIVAGGTKAKTLIKTEVLKMSSSNEDIHLSVDRLYPYNHSDIHDMNDQFKYADDDTNCESDESQSRCDTRTLVALSVAQKETKENNGFCGGHVTRSPLRRQHSSYLFQSKKKLYNRYSAILEERSQSFNLHSTATSSFRASSNRRCSKDSTTSGVVLGEDNTEDNVSLSTCNIPNQHGEFRIVPLYILGEKSQMKAMSKSESFPDVEFISIDFTPKNLIKDAYENLVKAVLPDNVSLVPIINHLNSTSTAKYQEQQPNFDNTLAIAANKWLLQVQGLLEVAGSVVSLIDTQSASVAVCLEDGWDATSQISSLAQVMLDPHYRTVAGFWALIEKDWIMPGHKFQSRLCQISNPKASNFFPVFLQFLDAVHQLLQQFPMSFEFNDFLLKFLAYHHMSNRFHDFKMDSEADRMAWLNVLGEECAFGSKYYEENSIWNYIVHHHEEWPVFFNFLYNPSLSQEILRPCTHLSMIAIWEYYLNEDLSSGSIYDLDHFCPSYRKRNTQHYDPILNGAFNNSHVASIYAILGLREGCEVKNWQKIWRESCEENESDLMKLESIMYDLYKSHDADSTLKLHGSSDNKLHKALSKDPLIVNAKINREHIKTIREICYVEHKNSSLLKIDKRHLENPLELSLGVTATDITSYQLNTQHNFQRLPAQCEFQSICDICRNRAPAIGTVMVRCTTCSMVCHDRCMKDSPSHCSSNSQSATTTPSARALSDRHIVATELLTPVSEISNHTEPSMASKSEQLFKESSISIEVTKKSEDPSTQGSEVIFSGDLWKLNQKLLFPNWQKKFFTLDIIRHELRYSDSSENRSNTKRIHIQDITGVRILTTLHNHHKRFPESAFLELQTEERTYKLASESPLVISEWMEKIQNSIQ